MGIPKTHTLTLTKKTITQSGTGSPIEVQSTVQTIAGSLQNKRMTEGVRFDKQTIKHDHVFYFDASLLATANKAELKEEALMSWTDPRGVSRSAQITGVDDSYVSGTNYLHYKIYLLEVK